MSDDDWSVDERLISGPGGGTWVRRQADEPQPHRCEPPMAWVAEDPMAWHRGEPEGRVGDLWRCGHCRKLWRVGDGCDGCDAYGHNHGGMCSAIPHRKWRPARVSDWFKAWARRR